MRRLSGAAAPATRDVDFIQSGAKDGGIRILDVRRKEDYMRGHIPESVNLPLADLLSDDSPERVLGLMASAGIGDDTPVVVYDDTFGALASRVAWTMEYLGHDNVSLLETTYSGWNEMGLESQTGDIRPDPADPSMHLHDDILATSSYLESARERDGVVLLDNRERLNYLEQHIPGAINIPYRTLASDNGILRSPEDMRRLLDNRNISANSEIITYCGSVGTLSGLGYYALKSIGMPNVRLYVRSFKEWKSLEKPTDRQPDANYWDLSAE